MNQSHVLYRVSDFVSRHLHCTDLQRIVLSLFTLHTYLWWDEATETPVQGTTPYVHVKSPLRRCGKTTLLELLELLCRNSQMVGARITAASLSRAVEHWRPTLLIDECGKLLRGDQRTAELLTGILDMGYRDSGYTMVLDKVDGKWVPRKLSCFCPKVIAGLGALPDTLVDRAIPIVLERAKKDETEEFFRDEVETQAKELQSELQNEANEIRSVVKEHRRPDSPPSLNARQRDVCRTLFAIADATGVWTEESRDAVEEIYGTALDIQEPDDDEALLADIREIINGCAFISSDQLVAALRDIEGGPWEYLSKNTLARKLKPFGVQPMQKHTGGTRRDKARGYRLSSFTPVFSRYLTLPSNRDAGFDTKQTTSIIPVDRMDGVKANVEGHYASLLPEDAAELDFFGGLLSSLQQRMLDEIPPAPPIVNGEWEKPRHIQVWPKPPAASLLVN